MPLFIYAVVSIIYMLQIIMVKQDMNVAMYNTTRTLSKYAYAYEALTDSDKEVSVITAYGTLLSELGLDYAKEHHIVGGNAGIVLVGTSVLGDGGAINITVRYAVKNPLDIWGIGIVYINQTYSSQGWLGDDGIDASILAESNERTVFITQYGEVYHTNEECAYISLSVEPVASNKLPTIRNRGGGKYYACEMCTKRSEIQGTVYVTSYGDRYHVDSECSGIRRTIIKVPFSKVGDRAMCQKCKGER